MHIYHYNCNFRPMHCKHGLKHSSKLFAVTVRVELSSQYRVGKKNRGHFVLQPITLEILNRSLPNFPQISHIIPNIMP